MRGFFVMVGYDSDQKVEMWEHLPTGEIRAVPTSLVRDLGIERAFGPVAELVYTAKVDQGAV